MSKVNYRRNGKKYGKVHSWSKDARKNGHVMKQVWTQKKRRKLNKIEDAG